MVRPRKTVFIIIVTCFICIPLVLQGGYTLTGKRYDIPLVGVASDTQAPKKSLQGFLEGSYQSDYEQWLNTNLIPRGVLVKLYNQIRYSLFNLGSEWIIGKNKDIIGLDYINEYLSLGQAYNFSLAENQQAMQAYVGHLVSVQDKLNKVGKSFLIYTTPSKAEYYPENIPEKYWLQKPENGVRGISLFRELIAQTDVNYLDTREIIEQNREYPLFYTTGIHWARPIEQQVSNAIFEKLEDISGKHFRKLELMDVHASETPFWRDSDVFQLQNLYERVSGQTYYEYDVVPVYTDAYDKLNILKQGGSFSDGLEHDYYSFFPNESYVYLNYNTYAVENGVWRPISGWEEIDLASYLDRADYVVIEVNDCVLPSYSNGFVEYLDLFLDSYVPTQASPKTYGVNLDASTLTGGDVCGGLYGFEDGFCWSTGKSYVILQNPMIAQNGLELQFNLPPELFQGMDVQLVAYVNQKKKAELFVNSAGPCSIILTPEMLSPAADDIYEIELYCSHSFIPAQLGISDDTRTLSMQIVYIGEVR